MANATFTNTDNAVDAVTGTSVADVLTADTTAVGGSGDANTINAGTGIDTVVMTGATLVDTTTGAASATEATFDGTTDTVTIGAGPQDTYALTEVEFLQFENGTLDLSATALAPQFLVNAATTDTLDAIGTTTGLFSITDPLRFDGATVELGTSGDDGAIGGGDDELFTVSQIDGNTVVPGNISIFNDDGDLVGRVTLNVGAGNFNFSVENNFYTTLTYGEIEVVTFDVVVVGDQGSTYTQTYTIDVVGDFSENNDTYNETPTGAIDALGGDDYINTTTGIGNYDVTAGTGNDTVITGDGNDTVTGDNGNDQIETGDGTDSVIAGNGNDNVIAGEGNDTVLGGAGDDALWAGSDDTGDDSITGGAGNDKVGGGAGNDTLTGDDNTDADADGVADNQGVDEIFGADGDDTIYTGALGVTSTANGDRAWAGAGADTIFGDDGTDVIGGAEGADSIVAGGGNDTVYGGADASNDTVDGGAGADLIYTGDGADIVTGGTGADTIDVAGTDDSADNVDGGTGDDLIYTGDGADVIVGGNGADTIYAGAGDDVSVLGGNGNDNIYGEDGNDSIDGGDNDDMLAGGAGDDILIGGDDEDILIGGAGDDVLTGNTTGGPVADNDMDTFVFAAGGGNDTITDFEDGTDMVDLSDLGIASLSELVLQDDGTNFIIHTSSTDSITLNGMTGAITDADIIFV
jgi:Ca2+-binding RTX toxin-like protein